ncbi:hypothetical protein SD427_08145 [Chryseobacterium sp. JJR-5R]|uniref:hypothetical protein n=1 Tax=Chryseobacterium sp. JJR-5R TaxID=3093923 RepID=UPI002A74DC50|nr:hypothetical protein [Chryseobacterium sp. JJR-5R]WPO84293.1 hypothetical protein SD427_08145 [Chryseobacterium sp. JJR-5R]
MDNYICYLKGKKENIHLIKILSDIFKCRDEFIGDLLGSKNFAIRFENRLLDNISEFCTELNIYIDDTIKKVAITNNFLFGIELSKYLNEEIVISTHSDDPCQWILIQNNSFFIAEEADDENFGITLQRSENIEISYDDAIHMSS